MWLDEEEWAYAQKVMKYDPRFLKNRIVNRIKRANKVCAMRGTYKSVTPLEMIRLFNIMEWKCVYCGVQTVIHHQNIMTPDIFTIDHLMPLSNGGLNSIDNIVCSCYACNLVKDKLTLNAYLEKIGIDEKAFREKHRNFLIEYYALTNLKEMQRCKPKKKKLSKNDGQLPVIVVI